MRPAAGRCQVPLRRHTGELSDWHARPVEWRAPCYLAALTNHETLGFEQLWPLLDWCLSTCRQPSQADCSTTIVTESRRDCCTPGCMSGVALVAAASRQSAQRTQWAYASIPPATAAAGSSPRHARATTITHTSAVVHFPCTHHCAERSGTSSPSSSTKGPRPG